MLFRFNDINRTFDLFDGLHHHMGRALAESARQTDASRLGAFDWSDSPEHYALTADLPGVDAKDLEITLQDEVLSINAKRTIDLPEGYRALRVEREAFELRRSFALPGRVDPDKVDANLSDGVLTLRLAKVEPEGPRQIAVSAK